MYCRSSLILLTLQIRCRPSWLPWGMIYVVRRLSAMRKGFAVVIYQCSQPPSVNIVGFPICSVEMFLKTRSLWRPPPRFAPPNPVFDFPFALQKSGLSKASRRRFYIEDKRGETDSLNKQFIARSKLHDLSSLP